MRLSCPICGPRDLREFGYRGDATLMARPRGDAGAEAFHDYLNLRENPEGRHEELWHHEMGCRSWLVVARDTRTHEVFAVRRARDVPR